MTSSSSCSTVSIVRSCRNGWGWFARKTTVKDADGSWIGAYAKGANPGTGSNFASDGIRPPRASGRRVSNRGRTGHRPHACGPLRSIGGAVLPGHDGQPGCNSRSQHRGRADVHNRQPGGAPSAPPGRNGSFGLSRDLPTVEEAGLRASRSDLGSASSHPGGCRRCARQRLKWRLNHHSWQNSPSEEPAGFAKVGGRDCRAPTPGGKR